MKYSLFYLLFFLLSLFSEEYNEIPLSEEKNQLSIEIYQKLQRDHYIKKKDLGDSNEKYILALIKKIDENKSYFTSKEIEFFVMRSKHSENENFDLSLAYQIINLYFKRLIDFSEYQIELIENTEFDFTKDEVLDIYYQDNEWVKDLIDLRELWRLETKNDFLVSQISDSADQNIRNDLIKRYKNRIRRISQQKEEDIFSLAINVLTNQFDPHSSYLSPRSAEDFDLSMSLKLSGIGALLSTEDDYTKIVELVPGGPAAKSGKIKPEDRISKIREFGSEKFTDVVGWRIDEVVDLIRGKEGTQVEIEFISFESDVDTTKTVVLKREEIKLEDRAAKSEILEINNNKIGIIDLPSFYLDFDEYQKRNTDYRSSSKDIKKILEDFDKNQVDALILDLRNNGGGALMEANKIIGLFVASGPTVQVKHSKGYVQPYGDTKAKQVWEKPIIVLVNRYSASASEIVAGAIQDYKRGIVVGQRTFGKGTVQSVENLSKGQIKITESKYYRISGRSTQNKGVIPDIELPVTWDIDTVGESSYPTALSWDVIRPFRHYKFEIDEKVINKVVAQHENRLIEEPNLNYLKEVKKRYDLNKNKKTLSLNLEKRIVQKELRRNWLLEIENERRQALNLNTFSSYDEMENFKETTNDLDQNAINLKDDYLLIESTKIVNDYLNFSRKPMISFTTN